MRNAKRRVSVVVSVAVLAASAACLTGCYERVVRAEGFGADQYDVSDSYQETSRLDRWLFGDPRATPSSNAPR